MVNCIYCGSIMPYSIKMLFCNLKCKGKFLITDYKTHPINAKQRDKQTLNN